MDGACAPSMAGNIVRRAQVACRAEDALKLLSRALGPGPFALVVLFVAPSAPFPSIMAEAHRVFPGTELIGCTTAGEIAEGGYLEDTLVAVAFPRDAFAAKIILVSEISAIDGQALVDRLITSRNQLARARPDFGHEFVFLLVDGLSTREDALTAEIAPGLGAAPLFGGSAGDGTEFRKTYVSANGTSHQNAAVLAVVRTACPIRVFKTDHLRPTERRMVVTGADPTKRIVHEINAEPAAREYARILGKDPEQLTTFTFAAHPVAVRMGGQHHVRAIQRVTEDGHLVFFCAIDEGLVLTLAEPDDMVGHLASELAALGEPNTPDIVLACDCILRRKEAEEKQLTRQISALLDHHQVVGFSTYGEQMNALHVNQTLTGVAIYPPPLARPS